MLMSYDEFAESFAQSIKSDAELIFDLLKSVIRYPTRYTGVFRVSNAETKLIQNVTQSNEIKFGDFMERIITEYISRMGYSNMDKNIGCGRSGDRYSADQIFSLNDNVFLIEQKIRDDHDSTKKRGQFNNFVNKYELLQEKYPSKNVVASMWFIDDTFTKNKKYYHEEAASASPSGALNIFYGRELFSGLFAAPEVWDEIYSHLRQNKSERGMEIISIPNFDNSQEVFDALVRLKREEPGLSRKLLSDKDTYVQLRKELFPTGENINRVFGSPH